MLFFARRAQDVLRRPKAWLSVGPTFTIYWIRASCHITPPAKRPKGR
jgi:hypothetical protein